MGFLPASYSFLLKFIESLDDPFKLFAAWCFGTLMVMKLAVKLESFITTGTKYRQSMIAIDMLSRMVLAS